MASTGGGVGSRIGSGGGVSSGVVVPGVVDETVGADDDTVGSVLDEIGGSGSVDDDAPSTVPPEVPEPLLDEVLPRADCMSGIWEAFIMLST